MKESKILGVKINPLGWEEILNLLEEKITAHKKVQVATVNNEFIVEAQKNEKFKDTLAQTFLSIPDSAGVVWALKKLHKIEAEKTPGVELFLKLCRLAQLKGYKIFLLGGASGVGEAVKKKIEEQYLGIPEISVLDGIEVSPDKNDPELLEKINAAEPQILFAALGAPKQELWIRNNIEHIDANIFVGIGGTLDYISGRVPRAPEWIRKIGLEWLFRLFQQPSRFPRIFRAVIVFPIKILEEKYFGK